HGHGQGTIRLRTAYSAPAGSGQLTRLQNTSGEASAHWQPGQMVVRTDASEPQRHLEIDDGSRVQVEVLDEEARGPIGGCGRQPAAQVWQYGKRQLERIERHPLPPGGDHRLAKR